MKKKTGRPRLPKGKAKAVQIGVRVTAEQARKIDELAKRMELSRSEWARQVLLKWSGWYDVVT